MSVERKGRRWVMGTVVAVGVFSLGACTSTSTPAVTTVAAAPSGGSLGATTYASQCALCHGADLRGTNKGPSHLSQVYEPGHHSDDSFRAAIKKGSAQHHWTFGAMPPIPGLTEAEIDAVIGYIREVQQKQGLVPYVR